MQKTVNHACEIKKKDPLTNGAKQYEGQGHVRLPMQIITYLNCVTGIIIIEYKKKNQNYHYFCAYTNAYDGMNRAAPRFNIFILSFFFFFYKKLIALFFIFPF